MPHDSTAKLLIIGAHPDDAEFHAGGMAALYHQMGRQVRMISVTNGNSGHHTMPREELAKVRKQEAANSGRVIGAEYHVWDHDDGSLTPSLTVREQIIREIRSYQPDLVLTHRPCDYHPDHRAVGQAVQDASYLITVPHIVPEVPALRRDPVVACMVDLFTRPNPLRPDVLLDISPYIDTIEDMFACHRSQVYEWLPYNQCIENEVPADETQRRKWLSGWVRNLIRPRADHFRERLIERYGNGGKSIKWLEAYEISEYAGSFEDGDRQRLFPFACAK